MFKYHAKKKVSINGKEYNTGDIVVSNIQLWQKGLEQMDKVILPDITIKPMDKPVDKGKVEIIFIRYNLKDIEDKAIAKVISNTTYPNYKITDFDNYDAKNNKSKFTLSDIWNKLIAKSKADYICLLNTDAFVTKGWLCEMINGFKEGVAATGPSGDKVGGVQRTIGTEELSAEHRGKYKELLQLSGFCLTIDRNVFCKVGDFPLEVPFYGGESAWCIKARRLGYKLMWAQGSFVYHLCGESVKKSGRGHKMRIDGLKQYAKWVAKSSPVLFMTYNRLDYTRKALKALLSSTCGNIIVFDNNSSDGTRKWLKTLNEPKISKVILNKTNIGIAGAMNKFFDMTEAEEFVGKVDNDTIVPKTWFEDLIFEALSKNIAVLQAKHPILHNKYKTFDEWMKTLVNSENVYYSDYVGGSGIVIKRAVITGRIVEGSNVLGGWTRYQLDNIKQKKAFCDAVVIKLLDMDKDNVINDNKYPDYYVKTGRTHNIVKQTIETMTEIISRLDDDKFCYIRFGDGEILMMEDQLKGKAWTQWNSPKFRKELTEAFMIDDPDYLIGLSAGMANEAGTSAGLFKKFANDEEMKEMIKKYYTNKTFYSPIALHYLLVFRQYLLAVFIGLLRKKKLGFVGGGLLENMLDIFEIDKKDWVETPPYQAYDNINKWYPKVKKLAERVDIILIAAGPTAKVVQKRLWNSKINVSTIDLGSIASALADNKEDKHTWIHRADQQIKQFMTLIKKL